MSLQDISNELNISKATISYVLNGRGDEKRISKKTQDKIIKFAKEHNYRANYLARALSCGKSEIIGLVVPNISDAFFATIARRIEKKADQSGYNVIFSSTGESIDKEKKIIQSMLERKVDGLIIVSSQKNREGILQLKKSNFPFVLIDRHYPDIETNFVGLDNEEGISLAVEQLLNTGRNRIGFVTVKDELESLNERLMSYLQTMKKHEIPVEEGFIQKMEREAKGVEMKKILEAMLRSPVKIDGIVFATQYLASSALRELKALKVNVPDDIALVSFGQKDDFDLYDPAVTEVFLPIKEMGDKAVELLVHDMMETTCSYKNIRFKTELILRKSCGNK